MEKYLHTSVLHLNKNCSFASGKGAKTCVHIRVLCCYRNKRYHMLCWSYPFQPRGFVCSVKGFQESTATLCVGFYAGTLVLRGNHLRLACKHASIWYWIGGAGKKSQSYYSSSWWGSIWLAWLGAQPTIMVRFVSKESLTREVCHLDFCLSDLLSTRLLLVPLWMMAKAVLIRPMFW